MNTDTAVRSRYSAAAQNVQPQLCCPIDYDARYLKIIPAEVIERDYGCGDPSRHVRPGETVLDLGSGGGKICFIASQVVGPNGRVIGVDTNDEMLDLARRSLPTVADALGFNNIEFRNGRIQDLAVDRDLVAEYLKVNPVTDNASLRLLEDFLDNLRQNHPLIADESIDVVVSNCVLNLVDASEKESLFEEIFRVLRPGGRAVISDIVSDAEVPEEMQNDPELWSGCISGALECSAFLEAFEQAGLIDVRLIELQSKPWQVVEGIEFRAATVIATRPLATQPEDSPAMTGDVRRIYRGPFKYAVDDNGVMFTRGEICQNEIAEAASRDSLVDQFAVIGNTVETKPQNLGLPTIVTPCC